MKKTKKMLLALCLLLISLCASVTTVSAANPLSGLSTQTRFITLGNMPVGKGWSYITPQYSSKIKVTAKSSNTKVAKVESATFKDNSTGKYYSGFNVTAVGPGKAKITVTAKIGKKSYRKTRNYVVYKYENPFKTLKIGSKSYLSKFKKQGYMRLPKNTLKGKLTVKLNKNFTLESIRIVTRSYYSKTIKSGQTLPADTYYVEIRMVNKKTKQTVFAGFTEPH